MVNKTKTSKTALKNNELLLEETLDAALIDAGLDVAGSLIEKAIRLEFHYLAIKQPAKWSSEPASKGGSGSWHLECLVENGGCGYTSTATQTFCVFCGDGKEETSKVSEAIVPHDPHAEVIDGEFDDDEGNLPAQAVDVEGSVHDLDAAINVVNEKRRLLEDGERKVTGAEWDLGVSIFDIFRRRLFAARTKDGGAPLYNSWSQFCKTELHMSSATTNRYMRIAVNFTRDLACELGPSKLAELLPAAEAQAAETANAARLGREPKQLLPALLDRARVLPVSDLRAEVRAAVPSPSGTKGGRTERATAAAAAAKKLAAKKPEKELVTVQRQEGTARIRFYVDEKSARTSDPKKVAKKFAEGVCAIEPAVNGVEVIYTLRMDATRGPTLHRKIVRIA